MIDPRASIVDLSMTTVVLVDGDLVISIFETSTAKTGHSLKNMFMGLPFPEHCLK